MDTININNPDNFINRELSLLLFNKRVLEQAQDERTPLLERLKFLCIASTNLDEFFEIRVAGLKQRVELGSTQTRPDGMLPQEVLSAIHDRAQLLVAEQYRLLNDVLIPELSNERIAILKRDTWTQEQSDWMHTYFSEEVLPVLSPLGLDTARPFPRIINKSLNFIVQLKGKDAFGRHSNLAIVQAPRSLPRVIKLPKTLTGDHDAEFVYLSSLIHAFAAELFSGIKVLGCYQFRVTRNSDLFIDDEEIEDLARALEGELASRRYGAAVRLEVARECPDELKRFLLDHFALGEVDLYEANGPVNLNRCFAVYDLVDRPDLKYPGFSPGMPTALAGNADIFAAIRAGNMLMHHPYQSFAPVVDFVHRAAQDPKVLAIKQTLYRTGPDSPVVDGLVAAAKNGKEVTVIIELRARFDEAANIALASRLQEAGAHVMYGVVGFKTHAKMLMVVRRESTGLRRYVHLGTGNYHPHTTRLYTDYGLFTCDPEFGGDVHELFLQLTSLTKAPKLKKILSSPFTLHSAMIEKIEREISFAAAGRPARIIAKINALVEPETISALYRASCTGVKIDLIVRGICCLRPGVPGLSENVHVRSLVGRFLEHSRIHYFHNDGNAELFLSSADWMDRNLFRRVETCCPILDKKLRKRLVADLEQYLADSVNAWVLSADGSYSRMDPGDQPVVAQSAFLQQMAETVSE